MTPVATARLRWLRRSGALLAAMAVMATLVAAPAGGAAAPVEGDVDGDGYAELLVGSPLDKVGRKGWAGSFSLLYGSRTGVSNHDQRWHRDVPGVRGVAVGTPDDEQQCCLGWFGGAVSYGDFNGDGYADVAATAAANPARGGYRAQPAGINVLYGSAQELTEAGDQLWTLQTTGVQGGGFAMLGSPIAGDFNGDGYDEFVFHNRARHGIHVLRGTSRGLTAKGDVLVKRSTAGVAGGGVFQGTLAVGDFNADGRDDLAVNGNDDFKGDVTVFYGGADLISPRRDVLWSLNSPGVPGESRTGDTFGVSLAAGDFDDDGDDDLAVGAERYNDSGDATEPEGRVTLLRGSAKGLTADGVQVVSGTSPGNPADPSGYFAWDLAAGDVDGDGHDDLAVYVAYEQTGPSQPSGAVHVIRGSADGLSTDVKWQRLTPSNPDLGSNQGHQFGEEMTLADYDGDGRDDLALTSRGGVLVVYGSDGGVDTARSRLWKASTPGIKGNGDFSDLQSGRWP